MSARRVSNLLDAGFDRNRILDIVKCLESTFFRVKQAKKNGIHLFEDLSRVKMGQPRTVLTRAGC